jgi:hypothetical protein
MRRAIARMMSMRALLSSNSSTIGTLTRDMSMLSKPTSEALSTRTAHLDSKFTPECTHDSLLTTLDLYMVIKTETYHRP